MTEIVYVGKAFLYRSEDEQDILKYGGQVVLVYILEQVIMVMKTAKIVGSLV